MLDTKDRNTSKVESQPFASKNNANTTNNDSGINNQTNGKPTKFNDDDSINENMIFPS